MLQFMGSQRARYNFTAAQQQYLSLSSEELVKQLCSSRLREKENKVMHLGGIQCNVFNVFLLISSGDQDLHDEMHFCTWNQCSLPCCFSEKHNKNVKCDLGILFLIMRTFRQKLCSSTKSLHAATNDPTFHSEDGRFHVLQSNK